MITGTSPISVAQPALPAATRTGRSHDAHISLRRAVLVWILASVIGWSMLFGLLLPFLGWFG